MNGPVDQAIRITVVVILVIIVAPMFRDVFGRLLRRSKEK